jgi:hypothetical protein
MGNELSLGTTFATLSLFLFIQKPFNVLPRFVATLSNTVISSGKHGNDAGAMRESPAARVMLTSVGRLSQFFVVRPAP